MRWRDKWGSWESNPTDDKGSAMWRALLAGSEGEVIVEGRQRDASVQALRLEEEPAAKECRHL